MAKDKITIEIDPDDLGVLSSHHYRMSNDQDYRDRALTPPGGLAPGEGDKPKDPTPKDAPVPTGAVQVGLANQ